MNHAKTAIAMLTAAHELYKRGSQRANRLIYHIGALLAREHLASQDVDTAHKLLQSVAGMPCLKPCEGREGRGGKERQGKTRTLALLNERPGNIPGCPNLKLCISCAQLNAMQA